MCNPIPRRRAPLPPAENAKQNEVVENPIDENQSEKANHYRCRKIIANRFVTNAPGARGMIPTISTAVRKLG
jgi:hypothetical protein